MKYVANKPFLHDQLGRVEKGQEFEATAAQIGGVLHFVSKVKAAEAPAKAADAKKSAKKAD